MKISAAESVAHQAVLLRIWGAATIEGKEERRPAKSVETYNIQGTAFPRELVGPALVVSGE